MNWQSVSDRDVTEGSQFTRDRLGYCSRSCNETTSMMRKRVEREERARREERGKEMFRRKEGREG